MIDLLEQLFSVIWQEEIVPRQWRGPYFYIHCTLGYPNLDYPDLVYPDAKTEKLN